MLEQPSFGQRLRQLRQQRGLSQSKLAGSGMSAAYLSRLESGARPPTAKAVEYLAEQLNVQVSAFDDKPADSCLRDLAKAVSTIDDGAAVRLFDSVVAETDQDPLQRWMSLWMRLRLTGGRGRDLGVESMARQLVSLGDECGDPELRVRSWAVFARLLRETGDMEAAHRAALEAVEIASADGLDASDRLRALLVIISTEVETSRMPDALFHVAEMADLLPLVSDGQRIEAEWTAAMVFVRNSDLTKAAEHLRLALAVQDGRSDIRMWMRLRFAAASLFLQMTPRRAADAEVLLDEAEPVVNLVATPQQNVEYLALRAHLMFAKGLFQEAELICSDIGDDKALLGLRDRLRLEMLTHQIAILTGREKDGITAAEALARQAQEASNIDLAAEIWRNLAETLSVSRIGGPPPAGAE